MMRFILNKILKFKGSILWVKGSNIHRKLPLGLSYVCVKCDSPEKAQRLFKTLSEASK